ncbi:hypothetical protein N7470_010071 [Penicillium chermesinum]|nr:hypothetical protein N7470_010071 [Penicillium chermesinum]
MPLIIDQVMGGYFEDELETEKQDRLENGGTDSFDVKTIEDDEMDLDDNDDLFSDWEGGTAADHGQLGSLLDECLSMAA